MPQVVTAGRLRVDFPEFASQVSFPDASLDFWLKIGENMLSPSKPRWGNMYELGIEMFAAHHATIEMQNQRGAAKGGAPGGATGAVASRSVGGVSLGYDTGGSLELGAGHWNMTNFGLRFIKLARMIGAGGLQLT